MIVCTRTIRFKSVLVLAFGTILFIGRYCSMLKRANEQQIFSEKETKDEDILRVGSFNAKNEEEVDEIIQLLKKDIKIEQNDQQTGSKNPVERRKYEEEIGSVDVGLTKTKDSRKEVSHRFNYIAKIQRLREGSEDMAESRRNGTSTRTERPRNPEGIGEEVPALGDCDLCLECFVQAEDLELPGRRLRSLEETVSLTLPQFQIQSPAPNYNGSMCQLCRGCSTILRPMQATQMFLGSNFTTEMGWSKGGVYSSTSTASSSSDQHRDMEILVKLWCLPKWTRDGRPIKEHKCELGKVSVRKNVAIRRILAMQTLAAECGLDHMTPPVWVERVRSVLPGGQGRTVDQDGLFQYKAKGISLRNMQFDGVPVLGPHKISGLLRNVSSSQVIDATIFDLLFSQCDRSLENVFISESGDIQLIDNEQGFGERRFLVCEVDSIFLPRTDKYEAIRAGFKYVLDIELNGSSLGPLKPVLLANLDYRCHTSGGTVGKSYPPAVKKTYQLPVTRFAENVKQRAHEMTTKGFEEALRLAVSRQKRKYPLHEPCCSLREDQMHGNSICAFSSPV